MEPPALVPFQLDVAAAYGGRGLLVPGGMVFEKSGAERRSYFPLIAASMLMWFSSRMVPMALCNAALAFT